MAPAISKPLPAALESTDSLTPLVATTDGRFSLENGGVAAIHTTADRKVEFVTFETHTLACVRSAMGYPAYYPVHPVEIRHPIKAVLMDLDGTSVRSEEFWMWIIEMTTADLLQDSSFRLCDEDLPFVSGHSVSEHLQYCIAKYAPHATVEEARKHYFRHTRREMRAILDGNGRAGAFTPSPGLKEFLLELKSRGIKIGLVTSGLYEKAWPEIVSAFTTLGMGDPVSFYDAAVTAGTALRKGSAGTMGELCIKPHPWLYAETARVGLGIPFEERHHVVGIEDSGAGVVSVRLAGFAPLGIGGGNIAQSGTRSLCAGYGESFDEILTFIG
ncbi:MAG: HAD hydrolase-like protein [Chitinivibrionales bacterium]|nr:HAD hydrolase-like protein [Chitinivibrionales bacterium]MBD3394935.1 HAD hydrolase-like protein [Chitinivibrionales bacterium]